MSVRTSIILALIVLSAVPLTAGEKKNQMQRGMLEKMEAVPCGAKQKGVTGFGAIWASVGITSVNSKENLCPQYLVRTDTNEYEIRPTDEKHPEVLPIGHEGQFKIKKDRMLLRIPDGDKKERAYQVVAMQPANSDSKVEGSAYRPMDKQDESRPMSAAGNPNPNPVTDRPPQP